MKNMKPFFRASLQSDGTLEMLVYDEIGKTWDGMGCTASGIKQQVEEAGPFNKIVMRINSPGGDAFEGIAIHNLVRSFNKPVEVCIDGVAASSASIIAMCGDEITMGNNAMMMIHNAWSVAIGEAKDMRKMADTLDKVSGSIAQTFVDRTGKSMDEIKKMMDEETWMSAEDCVKNGFATRIANEEDQEAMAMARSFKSLKNHKNLPNQLKAEAEEPEKEDSLFCDCPCERCVNDNCQECNNPDCTELGCFGCPMQNAEAHAKTVSEQFTEQFERNKPTDKSNLSQYEARLTLIKHPHK